MSTIISDMVSHLQCGVSIALNDAVYINSADGKIYKYDPLQPLQVYAGIAKEAGLLNAFIRVVQSGRVKGFTGLTPGAFVYASVTVPGGFQLTDPGSSLKVVLGIAKSATELTVNGALGIKTGGGTGSGGINYILNPDADTTVGWATYADAGGVTPVDGTGGSPTVTLTRSTSSPLRGTASFLYTKPTSNVQGQGFSYDFTIDSADTGKVLQGSFDYQIASGTFADDAMTVWIYDITNSRLIQPAPTKLKNSGIIERFPFEFQTSIDSTSYRLIIHQSSTSAVASTIKFDNFKVGPTAKAYGSAVTDWVNITPPPIIGTGGGTLNIGTGGDVEYSVQYKRIGDEVLVKYTLRIGTSGATDVTGGWMFSFPTGMTYNGTSNYETLGYGDITSTATGNPVARLTAKFYLGGIIVDISDSSTLASGGLAFNNTNILNMTIRYKVAGWSSSQIMSSDADTRVVAFNTEAFNVPYPSVTTPIIINATPRIDTHSGYNSTTGEYTIKVPGIYKIQGNVNYSIGSSATGTYINASVYKNSSSYNPITHRLVAGSLSTRVDFNRTETLKAGDVITLRILATDATLSAAASNLSSFSVERLSGPVSIAASESVSAFYSNSAGTSIPHATDTKIPFATRLYDSHNAFNTSTNEYECPMSGTYRVTSSLYYDATSALVTDVQLNVYVQGAIVKGVNSPKSGTSSTPLAVSASFSVKCLAGQTIYIGSYQNSGGTRPLITTGRYNWIEIERTGNY